MVPSREVAVSWSVMTIRPAPDRDSALIAGDGVRRYQRRRAAARAGHARNRRRARPRAGDARSHAVRPAPDRQLHGSVQRVPVDEVEIVGSDLHLVEHVTGRLTTARAAMAGAGSGAWFGLFVGLLVGLFTTGPTWLGLVLGGAAIGALWGALFGFFA